MLKANKIIGIINFPGKKYLNIERKTSGLQEKQLLYRFFDHNFSLLTFVVTKYDFLLQGKTKAADNQFPKSHNISIEFEIAS